uniref:Uncharacterized protein n=1 Tax=Solanum tuberosum TaxID=4113 RepID=M0ZH69_SOLTU
MLSPILNKTIHINTTTIQHRTRPIPAIQYSTPSPTRSTSRVQSRRNPKTPANQTTPLLYIAFFFFTRKPKSSEQIALQTRKSHPTTL